MKNLLILAFFIIAMVLVQFAKGQTVDDIINKYIDALGGKEKLASLKTIQMEGTLNTRGYDLPIKNVISHMLGSRLDIEVSGALNYQIVNTTKGVAFWPSLGMAAPEDMQPDQYRSALNKLDIQGSLNNYKEKGMTIELMGKQTIDSTEAYDLKVIFKNGITGNYYIDTRTNRLIKTLLKLNLKGQDIEEVVRYADYKTVDGGYWFAHTITNSTGVINYTSIVVNKPVDEALFKN